jgi:hypothetical protein
VEPSRAQCERVVEQAAGQASKDPLPNSSVPSGKLSNDTTSEPAHDKSSKLFRKPLWRAVESATD